MSFHYNLACTKGELYCDKTIIQFVYSITDFTLELGWGYLLLSYLHLLEEVNRSLQTELDSQRITEPPNSFSDAFRAGSSKRSTEEHLFLVDSRRLEPAATRDKDAVINGSEEHFLFNGLTSLAGSQARVLLPINLDPVLSVC